MSVDAERRLERYLHQHIPLSAAMGVRVLQAAPQHVQLAAPLAPNLNHLDTLFGGSAAAVATLCAWTLLHLRLEQANLAARLVIQRSAMEYEHPITADFEASCRFEDEQAWQRFRATFVRHARSRITLGAQLVLGAERKASFQGDFVALAR
jgi:thioesterase domain-containing protein